MNSALSADRINAPAHLKEEPALELWNVNKRYPGVLALDDVSLTIRRGEIHAIIGQNGAGKSTMINVVSGMVRADSGTISMGGRPAPIESTETAIELGIATVYQELSLLPNLTIEQNLALGREPRKRGVLDISRMRDVATAALRRVALDIPPNTRIGALPLAERQLVEIAKALAARPSVLILDEPTAALGGREVEQLFAILRALRDDGVAIVYVSHRFREILALCDRATVLRNGRVVITTELQNLTEADLTEAMVGSRTDVYRRARDRDKGPLVLECRGLGWRDRVAGVSFTVAKGEIVALTGLLGAGQNEIARMVGGDLEPQAGHIAVRGIMRVFDGPSQSIGAGVSLLTDERKVEGILPNLSLSANIALPSLDRRRAVGLFVASRDERAAVTAELGRFGVVAASAEAPMRSLSGGNQQKALIARWHLADADLFVLIEPTYGVDVAARADIYRRIDDLAAAGKAFLIVSSDPAETLALSDRILVIREGRLVAEAQPSDTDEERLNLLVQGAA